MENFIFCPVILAGNPWTGKKMIARYMSGISFHSKRLSKKET